VTDLIEVKITALGAQGDGIGEYGREPVFVPGTTTGDLVRAEIGAKKKNGYYAVLDEIIEASADRIDPVCKHFGKCGGCQLQFLSEDTYRNWISERAVSALTHQGVAVGRLLEPVICPPRSRRRVALKALNLPGRLVLGFSERQSHQLVDIGECPVTRREITEILPALRKVLQGILKKRMTAEVHVTLTATGIDILVDAAKELDLSERESLVDFANAHDIAAIHWRDQGFLDPVIIRREPMMEFSDARAPLAPAAFIQATNDGEAALVKEVVAACVRYGRVADLFCGMGTFTFPLAKSHQTLAVEGAKQPLEALKAGINQASGLKQIITMHRDLYRRPLTPDELSAFDAVVFDPPRAGAKEQAAELAQSSVKKIVAVSCNPNSFARDAKILVAGGYQLETLLPVDQFLWSPHLELVGVFSRV